MKASEFNLKYKNHLVQLHVNIGQFKGSSYNTTNTIQQAWTNHKYECCIDVKGLNSSIRLCDCTIVKSTLMGEK